MTLDLADSTEQTDVDATTDEPVARTNDRRNEVLHFVAVFGLAVLALTPGIFRAGSRIFGWPGDASSAMWIGWRIGELLKDGRIPTRLPDIFYPYGFDLMASDGYGPNLLMGIFNVITGSPTLSYDLVLLSGVAVTGVAASIAAKQLGGSRWVRFVVAVAAIATPILSVRLMGHPHLTFIGLPLLVINEGLRVSIEQKSLRWKRTAVLLYVSYLCGAGLLLAGGVALAVILAVESIRQRTIRTNLVRLVAAGTICLVGMSPFILARSQYSADEQQAALAAGTSNEFERWLQYDSINYATEQGSFFVPPFLAVVKDWPGPVGVAQQRMANNIWESSLFLGVIPSIGLALLVAFRSRVRLPLLLAGFTAWLLAAGPLLRVGLKFTPEDLNGAPTSALGVDLVRFLPFQLFQLVPGLEGLRTPGRFLVVLPALLALGIVPAAAYLKTRWNWQARFAVGAVLVLATVPFTMWPIANHRALPVGEVEAAFDQIDREAAPGDTVAIVPADCIGITDMNRTMIQHGQPMVGCLGPFSAVRWYSEMDLYVESPGIAALSCRPERFGPRVTEFAEAPAPTKFALEDLRQRFGVRYLIVREEFFPLLCAPERAAEIREFTRTLDSMGTDTNLTVIDLGPAD